jgi:DNA-binding NarL/FixJ family response regulator
VQAGCSRFFGVSVTPLAYEDLPAAGPSTTPSVSVVAADVPTLRRITAALAAEEIHVVGVAANPDELAHGLDDPQPDVCVLACDLADSGHLTWLRRLRRDLRDAALVMVACGSQRASAREALNTGADGFVLEAELEAAIAPVVRTVAAGQITVPRLMRRCVVRPAFSHRERQVLALMVEGLQNREIADRLYLAESTVKSHLASSFEKLGVRSRKEAAALVLDPEEGLRALILENGVAPTPSTQEHPAA